MMTTLYNPLSTFIFHFHFHSLPALAFSHSLPYFSSFPTQTSLKTSSDNSSSDNSHPELQVEEIHAEGAPQALEAQALILLEEHHEVRIPKKDEYILRSNFEILSSITLHFQNPATWTINSGEVTLFESVSGRTLTALPAIARELQLFLNVAPSQIVLNGWKYLFASHILWPTVLEGQRMTILVFFNIYCPSAQRDGTMAFQVRQNPIFIYLKKSYSNNKYWEEEFLRV